MDLFMTRAAAHSDAAPHAAQRFQHGVTDQDVAAVFYALEAEEVELYRNSAGRWLVPLGARGFRKGLVGRNLSVVVTEMIRTGLVRHVIERGVDYLVPARLHLADGRVSACRFTGEDMGPMRARLVIDLALVDCLECESAVSHGGPRGL